MFGCVCVCVHVYTHICICVAGWVSAYLFKNKNQTIYLILNTKISCAGPELMKAKRFCWMVDIIIINAKAVCLIRRKLGILFLGTYWVKSCLLIYKHSIRVLVTMEFGSSYMQADASIGIVATCSRPWEISGLTWLPLSTWVFIIINTGRSVRQGKGSSRVLMDRALEPDLLML